MSTACMQKFLVLRKLRLCVVCEKTVEVNSRFYWQWILPIPIFRFDHACQ